MGEVPAAALAFVGTHFLLSHPLRAPLLRRIGERGFLALYSVVAAVTLGWLAIAYRATPAAAPLWPVGDAMWMTATIAMLLASMLFVGSLVRNPALPGAVPVPASVPGGGAAMPVPVPRGVYAVTRHPMMWSIALWGAAHILVYPDPSNIVLAAAMIVLALAGAWLQDRKKRRVQPGFWPEWQRRTSYLPFAAIAGGRARVGAFGAHTLGGGVLLWLVATWTHLPLAGWAAGIWRWIA